PLEVTPASADADAQTPPTPEQTAESGTDDLPPAEDLVAAHQRGFLTRNLLPAGALTLAGIVVLGVLLGGRLRRTLRHLRNQHANRDRTRMHEQTAGEVRRQLTSSVQSVHEVRELLQKVLRRQYGMPPGEITPYDAALRLRQAGVDEGLAGACAELLEACAAAEFAPGVNPVSLPELRRRAGQLTSRLG